MSKVAALILCAGTSTRFGRDKLLLPLGDKPVWRWSLDAFLDHPEVDLVGIVTTQDKLQELKDPRLAFIVPGGSTRQESSRIGLSQFPDDVEIVLIHDGARPFVTPELISEIIAATRRSGAATPGCPVTDTIKLREGSGSFTTLDRSMLVAVQTPQGARLKELLNAHRQVTEEATDDLALLEKLGQTAELVLSPGSNIKITTEEDYRSALLKMAEPEMRTGFGYDIHAFSPDPHRALFLGGIHFPDSPALDGHSDADVLLHAIADALLGSASLGDIGQLFPNTDAQYRNAPSRHFVEEAGRRLAEQGWAVVNIDATVVAESPKIGPRRQEIEALVANMLNVEATRISVKATTNEKLGAIGRSEGIAAFAVATVRRRLA